ncbi:MAG: hypothetical protein V1888_02905 [archaeon]
MNMKTWFTVCSKIDRVGVMIVLMIMIFSVGVLAESVDIRGDIIDFMKEKNVSIGYEDIVEVNFSNLPGELDIEKIDGTNIGIYQVSYDDRSLFVIGNSGEATDEIPVSTCEARLLLSFGVSGEVGESGFLNMANGVNGNLEKGYIMLKSGSITGISSNLEVKESVEDRSVEIVIYKNGEEIGFRNVLSLDSEGVVIDYDVQSEGIVNFKTGDVISVYLNSGDNVLVSDITTLIEVTE